MENLNIMNKQEIENYNRLCAEFLGWKNLNDDSFPEYVNPLGDFYQLKELKFHSDWNWIMAVVEAIEELDIIASFQIEQPTIYIWKSSETSTFEGISIDIFTMSKKEAVVQAINKFLIWYNNGQRT